MLGGDPWVRVSGVDDGKIRFNERAYLGFMIETAAS